MSACGSAGLPEVKALAESQRTVHTAVVQTPVAVASNLAWHAAVYSGARMRGRHRVVSLLFLPEKAAVPCAERKSQSEGVAWNVTAVCGHAMLRGGNAWVCVCVFVGAGRRQGHQERGRESSSRV